MGGASKPSIIFSVLPKQKKHCHAPLTLVCGFETVQSRAVSIIAWLHTSSLHACPRHTLIPFTQRISDLSHSGKLSSREVPRDQARHIASKVEGGACLTFTVIRAKDLKGALDAAHIMIWPVIVHLGSCHKGPIAALLDIDTEES